MNKNYAPDKNTTHPLHAFWLKYPKAVQWQLQWLSPTKQQLHQRASIETSLAGRLAGTFILGSVTYCLVLLIKQHFVVWHLVASFAGVYLLLSLGKWSGSMIPAHINHSWTLPALRDVIEQPPTAQHGKIRIAKKHWNPITGTGSLGLLGDQIAPQFDINIHDHRDRHWHIRMRSDHYAWESGEYEAELFFHRSKPYPVLVVAGNNVVSPLSATFLDSKIRRVDSYKQSI